MNTEGNRPVMLFDGDCGFCRFWVARWQHATRGCVEYEPFQERLLDFSSVPRSEFETAVQLICPDGRRFSGADAVFEALTYSRGPFHWISRLMQWLPGGLWLSRKFYKFIARNRTPASWLTRVLWGRVLGPPTYFFARWLFLRLLGLSLLFAFVSLLVQIRGLAGSKGILPADRFLDAVRQQLGPEGYRLLPTLYWFGCNDAALIAGCVVGVGLSVLVIAGFSTSLALLGAWVLYLSLAVVCQDFLQFQWDSLLLETTLLAAFFCPPFRWREQVRNNAASTRIARWMLLWLLFRLMFESGAVKLSSGDETWRNLTALDYHYETQPLPGPLAWWAHNSPEWLRKTETALMFVIELGAPLCIIMPRRVRVAGFLSLTALQLAIATTGNYAFFNFLTAALGVLMVDDASWPKRWTARILGNGSTEPSTDGWPAAVAWTIAGVSAVATLSPLIESVYPEFSLPYVVNQPLSLLQPLRSFNGYGLFRVMTTFRHEIVIEGSNDGESWKEYEFRWKPGDVNRMPPICAPHQPRLDWQMWFAALGTYRQNPWFVNLLVRLLQGSPAVTSLLGTNPFPDKPPVYIRAVLYDYHFTRQGPAWWRREKLGLYFPAISLKAVSAPETANP